VAFRRSSRGDPNRLDRLIEGWRPAPARLGNPTAFSCTGSVRSIFCSLLKIDRTCCRRVHFVTNALQALLFEMSSTRVSTSFCTTLWETKLPIPLRPGRIRALAGTAIRGRSGRVQRRTGLNAWRTNRDAECHYPAPRYGPHRPVRDNCCKRRNDRSARGAKRRREEVYSGSRSRRPGSAH